MRLRSHKGFIKSVCVLCAIALQFNTFADWWDDAKQTASKKWAETRQRASEKWEEVKQDASKKWEETKQAASVKWVETKQGASKKWQETKQWCSENKEEIITTLAVATAVAIAISRGQDASSVPTSYDDTRSSGYSYRDSHSTEGAYRPFSAGQKADILQQNRERNGGVLRSDYSGRILEEPGRYTKGYTPSPNEAQVDHITPRSHGGWNSAGNAQVLSREENLRKSDK